MPGEPSVMVLIKRPKIIATRVYEFFEGGDLIRQNRTTFSDLRKSGIHQAFGEFVIHTPTVAAQALAECCAASCQVRPHNPYKTIKPSW